MATLQRWAERRLCRRLGVPEAADAARYRPLLDDARSVAKESRALAKEYAAAVRNALSRYGPEELTGQSTSSVLARKAMRAGREAVIRRQHIEVLYPKDEVRRCFGVKSPDRDSGLFDLIVRGRLAKNAAKMARIREPDRIIMERLYAVSGVYRVTVRKDTLEKTVFVKDAGMGAEMFASGLLKKAGIIVPRIRGVGYRARDGAHCEYGLMQDIRDAQGPGEASSLRALGRSAGLASIALGDLNKFASTLGYAYETFRCLGVQDMHARNMYVKDVGGRLAVGVIDFGVVACYASNELYSDAYAGQLHTIIDALDFALEFGKIARSAPQRIGALVGSDIIEKRVERRGALAEKVAEAFFSGAAKAQGFYLEPKNQRFIMKSFRRHDGKPVGWSSGMKNIRGKGEPLTCVNGSVNPLFSKGPYEGMFPLRWKSAWEKGFQRQVRTRAQDFWRSTLDYLKLRLPDWLEGKGPAGRASTMAY